MKIGIAGMGRMGAAIATRLIGLGHEVGVWNRTAAKAQALAAAGASLAATPAELAARSEVIISILTNAQAIDDTYLGTAGLLAADVRGKLFIEMSTVRPDDERSLAASIRSKGATMIECPVGGTIGPAREGKLLAFVGGEPDDVERARPLLEQMCRRIEYVGSVGAGASVKLAVNLPLLVFWQAFGEALSLCQDLGLDPARLVDIFAETSGGPAVLKGRGPMIVKALKGEDSGPVTFDVELARKDLRTMVEEAAAQGRKLPVTAQALACFDEAIHDGLAASDAVAIPAHWLKRKKSSGA